MSLNNLIKNYENIPYGGVWNIETFDCETWPEMEMTAPIMRVTSEDGKEGVAFLFKDDYDTFLKYTMKEHNSSEQEMLSHPVYNWGIIKEECSDKNLTVITFIEDGYFVISDSRRNLLDIPSLLMTRDEIENIITLINTGSVLIKEGTFFEIVNP
jgi:hypothetical protein